MVRVKKIALVLATGFGLGYAPIASGTVGTLPGIGLAFLASHLLTCCSYGIIWQALLAAVLAALAIPICDVAEKHLKEKDDGRIVADEYLTFPIAMIGLPWNVVTVVMAFLTCRACDIIKPPPARQLQSVRGGVGVVIDDVFASVYSLILNHLLYWFVWPVIEPMISRS